MTEPGFAIDEANGWFARDLNNATWAWLDAHELGESTDPIIHVAHASYYHWGQIGETINQARAASLVANVHAACGNGQLAHALAVECLELFDQAGDATADWDIAFGHDSLARALAALDSPEAGPQRALARTYGDAIADPDDKQVFDDWFNRFPPA